MYIQKKLIKNNGVVTNNAETIAYQTRDQIPRHSTYVILKILSVKILLR